MILAGTYLSLQIKVDYFFAWYLSEDESVQKDEIVFLVWGTPETIEVLGTHRIDGNRPNCVRRLLYVQRGSTSVYLAIPFFAFSRL